MRKNGTNGHTNGTAHKNGVNRIAGLLEAPSETEANGAHPESEPPEPARTDGRQDGGRFAPGNKIARGNPFSRKLGAMRNAFLNAISEAEVEQLASALLKQAIAGDVEAAKVFLAYIIGKPGPAVDVDTLDFHEMGLLLRRPDETSQAAIIRSMLKPGTVEAIRQRMEERLARAKDKREEEAARAAAEAELLVAYEAARSPEARAAAEAERKAEAERMLEAARTRPRRSFLAQAEKQPGIQ